MSARSATPYQSTPRKTAVLMSRRRCFDRPERRPSRVNSRDSSTWRMGKGLPGPANPRPTTRGPKRSPSNSRIGSGWGSRAWATWPTIPGSWHFEPSWRAGICLTSSPTWPEGCRCPARRSIWTGPARTSPITSSTWSGCNPRRSRPCWNVPAAKSRGFPRYRPRSRTTAESSSNSTTGDTTTRFMPRTCPMGR